MVWRALRPDEYWDYDDENDPDFFPEGIRDGPNQGYAVNSLIFFDGHKNCECDRAQYAERVTWFLQHNQEFPLDILSGRHGYFPLDFMSGRHRTQDLQDIAHASLIAQLRDQLGSLRNGFIVQLDKRVMFGEIISFEDVRSDDDSPVD